MNGTDWRLDTSALAAPLLLLAMLLGTACDGSGSPSEAPKGNLFVIRACRGSEHAPEGELFRALIRDPGTAAEAQKLVGAGEVKILAGPLDRGDGGFNDPWSWHLDPDQVRLVEGAIELCDGCPSFVEADLDYWIDTVGTYCPWSTEVVSRLR